MKISTKEALCAAADADWPQSDREYIPLKDIAKRQIFL
jgi:hypothetical protein